MPWRRGHGRPSTHAGSPTSVKSYCNSPSASVCHEQDDLPRQLWDPYLNNLLGCYQSIFSSAYLSAWYPQFDHITAYSGIFLHSFEQHDRNRTAFFSELSGQYWGWCPTLSWCQGSDITISRGPVGLLYYIVAIQPLAFMRNINNVECQLIEFSSKNARFLRIF